MRDASVADSVNATKPDTMTAPASVSANSVKNRPVLPSLNAIGVNTAASVNVIATIAKPICFEPTNAALIGSMPCSM